MFDPADLLAITQEKMPFGKYQGRYLVDVPEEYLLWLNRQGMPKGRLGNLLSLVLEIKINGLEAVLTPLRKS